MAIQNFRGTKSRDENRNKRSTELQGMNSNDMQGAKSLVIFVSALIDDNKDFLEERIKSGMIKLNEQKLINKMREKLDKGTDEAVKFLKSDEFKDLNKKSYNFDKKEIDTIEKGIKNKELRVENILDINKDNLKDKAKDSDINKNKQKQRNS